MALGGHYKKKHEEDTAELVHRTQIPSYEEDKVMRDNAVDSTVNLKQEKNPSVDKTTVENKSVKKTGDK